MNKKKGFAVGLLVLVIVLGLLSYKHFTNRLSLNLEYDPQKIEELYVYSDKNSGNQEKASGKIEKPGKPIKLKRGIYYLNYTAKNGYQSDHVRIDLTKDSQNLSINPEYTQQELSKRLNTQIESIDSAIKLFLGNEVNEYIVNTGKLYSNDEWYGTTLTYNGNDAFMADTLKIILKKDKNSWTVATNPPAIILSSVDYKDIPVDILKKVNEEQNAAIQQKYLE